MMRCAAVNARWLRGVWFLENAEAEVVVRLGEPRIRLDRCTEGLLCATEVLMFYVQPSAAIELCFGCFRMSR